MRTLGLDGCDIYNLKWHETVKEVWDGDREALITRVAGGWIYRFVDYVGTTPGEPVFVPYNNEFMDRVTDHLPPR